ncbi:MAG: hypothetical protein Q4A32_09685 [Lachnospiraceae bacterium]|nr:hypothetical protein [Lachnospiraceae bacterium]
MGLDMPFQIVITEDLEGDEYAACRALTDKADANDLRRVIEDAERGEDDSIRGYYRILLTFFAEKNPDTFKEIRRMSKDMKDALMELMKDDIDEKVNDAVREAVSSAEAAVKQKENVSAIRNIMESFGVTLERAMETMKIPPSQQAIYANLVNKMS